MRRVILVGATDGIGLSLARLYLSRMWWVCVLGRDPKKLESVRDHLRSEFPEGTLVTHLCDVTKEETVRPAFESALEDLGQADLVVYCAGVMPEEDHTASDFPAASAATAVNLVGAMHVLGLAADYFRAARRGHIAAIGSVAGERGRKGNPAYCAAKAGLHSFLEGLRNRLHPYGVRVSTIKPGFVNTRMLRGRSNPPGTIEPATAAKLIARGLDRGRECFFVPRWWFLVALAVRLTPRSIFKRFGPA